MIEKKQIKSPPRYKGPQGNVLAIILKNMDSNMDIGQMITPQYQNATLSVEHTGKWRICWYNYNPATGELERIRKTCKLNLIKDLAERKRVADNYIFGINAALKNGFNWFLSPEENAKRTGITDLPAIQAAMRPAATVVAAVEQALKIRLIGITGRSVSSYSSIVRRFTEFLTENGQAGISVQGFTTVHYYEYLFHKGKLGHGNKNTNETNIFLRSIFEIIRTKLKMRPDNPLDGIDKLPEAESQKFQPLTAEELKIVVPALIEYNPRFYLFCKFIPDEYIRPHHIARLKSGFINYSTDEISLSGDSTKSKRVTAKQLMGDLKKLLLEMGCNKVPANHYLFSNLQFEPGPKLYPSLSNRASEIWKEVIIDKLGINKQMYGLKYTSAQYFVNNNANIDVYYLRQQMEHSSARQTEIYLQKNVKKRINEKDVKTLKF